MGRTCRLPYLTVLPPQRKGFDPSAFRAGFVADEVTLVQVLGALSPNGERALKTEFCEIWYLSIFRKSPEKFDF